MRGFGAFLIAVLSTSPAEAAPKKPSDKSDATGSRDADAEALESPYSERKSSDSQDGDGGGGEPAKAADRGRATGGGEATEREGSAAPVSGDEKLDAPPTTGPEGSSGTPSSPLNPEADEFPKKDVFAAPPGLDALLSDIATLRSRVATLTASLFSSELEVVAETEGDDSRIDRLVVTVDDGVVFASSGAFVAEDEKVLYQHAVAPGDHVIGVEVERHDARGKAFRTYQESRFAVVVPDKKHLRVEIELSDDSDMAEDFTDDRDGSYELGVRLRAWVDD